MKKFWNDLPIERKLWVVFGTMAVLILLELLTLRLAMQNLSAVRAFVSGEGHWSRAQNQAIFRLQRYAITGDPVHLEKFHEALKVIDGDHEARVELGKPRPDMAIVKRGFIQGKIHPDDVEPMVKLLRRFSRVSYISEAVATWAHGDALVSELKALGEEYRIAVSSGKPDAATLTMLGHRLELLNEDLSKATIRFSAVLGEGSRWMEGVILYTLLLLVMTVESVGLTLTFLMGRDLSRRVDQLVKVADHIGAGSFSERLTVNSTDEIGKLQLAINKMGSLLETSYRDLEGKISDRTKELEAVAKTQQEFLSIASHELRTPIMALGMQIEMIERNLAKNHISDKAKLRDQVDKAHRIHRRLAGLLDVLIDLTKISTGQIEIHCKEADLSQVVREVIRDMAPLAASSKIPLEFHIEDNVSGNFDPVRMGQVLTNLINNAFKYGNNSPVEVRLVKDKDFAVMSVSDKGPGIPPEKKEKIFERFERGNEELAIGGLGLGLYIGREIVKNHDGEISVASTPGQGATFTVRIPLQAPASS